MEALGLGLTLMGRARRESSVDTATLLAVVVDKALRGTHCASVCEAFEPACARIHAVL